MSITKKLANIFAGVVVALVAFGMMASTASAALSADLRAALEAANVDAAVIAALDAAMGGSSASVSTSANTYHYGGQILRPGASGAAVMDVQNALLDLGYNLGGYAADGKYGPATASAVAAFQTDQGLTVDSKVGPNTAAALEAATAALISTSTPTPTTPDLCPNGMTLESNCTEAPGSTSVDLCPNGMTLASNCTEEPGSTGGSTAGFNVSGNTQGTIDDVTVGVAEESEINEGESEVEVYALDFELDDNGPLMVQSMDFWFGVDDTTANSTKPWDYFEEVAVIVDGEKVAELDASSSSDWSSYSDGQLAGANTDREYRLRFTNMDSILVSDDTTTVSLAVSARSVIDSQNDGAEWYVAAGTARLMDESGFTFSDNIDNTYAVEESFTVNASAEEASLDISDASDAVEAQVIEVSKTNDTNGVTIYAFDVEEDNNVDVNIEEMTLTFVATDDNGAVNENVIIKRAYLYQGNSEVGAESMTSSGVVVFDNLDIDIDGNDTETFYVKVDIDDTNNGARYAEPATIQASVTSLDLFTDANGNDEDDITPAISGAGETHELRTEGVMIELLSATENVTSSGDPATVGSKDKGTFKISFKATAFGADQRIDKSSVTPAASAAGEGVGFSHTAGTLVTSSLTSASTDTEDTANTFELDRNNARTFTLTVVLEGDNDLAEVSIDSINYGVATDDTNAEFYDFELDTYKTDELYLNAY